MSDDYGKMLEVSANNVAIALTASLMAGASGDHLQSIVCQAYLQGRRDQLNEDHLAEIGRHEKLKKALQK